MNDLDRALISALRNHGARPYLQRCLGEGDLWFLTPHRPGMEGKTLILEQDAQVMMVPFNERGGPAAAVYTSFERAEESLRNGRIPEDKYSIVQMGARLFLNSVTREKMRVILNKGCETGELLLSAEMLAGALQMLPPLPAPPPADGQTYGPEHVVDAGDYPTNMMQAMFERLREHPVFRAGWIFQMSKEKPDPRGGRRYLVLLVMDHRDMDVFTELLASATFACPIPNEVQMTLRSPQETAYLASLHRLTPPFYQAADYQVLGSEAESGESD